MDVLQIVAIGLIATVLIVVVRSQRPELAVLLSVAAGVIIFLLVLGKISSIMDVIKELASSAGINMVYMGTILKIIGIAYIAEFGAQICRDAGEGPSPPKLNWLPKFSLWCWQYPL